MPLASGNTSVRQVESLREIEYVRIARDVRSKQYETEDDTFAHGSCVRFPDRVWRFKAERVLNQSIPANGGPISATAVSKGTRQILHVQRTLTPPDGSGWVSGRGVVCDSGCQFGCGEGWRRRPRISDRPSFGIAST